MATVSLRGTQLTFSLIPPDQDEREWATTYLLVENERFSYEDTGKYSSIADIEELIISLSRLLAGGYEREYSISLDGLGIAVDLYAPMQNGRPLSRDERQESDCVAAIRLLMRSTDKSKFLDGVYTLLLHRRQIEVLVEGLRSEYNEYYAPLTIGKGQYRFVGVSPRGYKGCNYLYYDESGEMNVGDYAWVRMGRRQIEQVVYVDSVRTYSAEDAPYDPQTVKKILRKATKEEIAAYLAEWKR